MKSFSLLIKPASADCNLACAYCFYIDRCALYPGTQKHRMSAEVLERMVRSFLATDQPQHAFGWQGGEPTLMGLDFFRAVTTLQERYGKPGGVVSNGLQTNGTLLTPEWAAHLAKYRFLVGVSMDGPPEIHNRYRRYGDGRESHAAVCRGIGVLRDHGVDFNILTLVSQSNVHRPVEVYRYLCDQGFLYHQYIECVEFDERGRLQPFAVDGESWGDFLCAVFDEWMRKDTRRVSVRLFDSILTLLVQGIPNVCHMGRDCRQYVVVEHNGDVYPCDFFVRADLKLGNVMQDEWAALQADPAYLDFGRKKRLWNEACRDCEWLLFCGADCVKNRPGGQGDPGRLSALCAGWKRFYAHSKDGFTRLAAEIGREREQARRVSPQGVRPGSPVEVGRNEACPCGSGRKYKRCCGAR